MRAVKVTREKYRAHTLASLAMTKVQVAECHLVAGVGDGLAKTGDNLATKTNSHCVLNRPI